MKNKFRAYHNGRFYYSDNNEGECFFSLDSDGVVFEVVLHEGYIETVEDAKIDQFTGVKDKHGVDIYERDKLVSKTPYRSTETHFGENIPSPCGSYTQQLEPEIKTEEFVVSFYDGAFVVDINSPFPLFYLQINYDLKEAKEGFGCSACPWNDEDEGELQYLLNSYKIDSEDDLVKSLGIEVIGNTHEAK